MIGVFQKSAKENFELSDSALLLVSQLVRFVIAWYQFKAGAEGLKTRFAIARKMHLALQVRGPHPT